MSKVLFILKRREDFNATKHNKIGLTTGLYNSAFFVNEMLNELGIESKMSVVTDNNDIDREVTLHKPTHVIIEAVWVIPSKFYELQKLHPEVIWIIRVHSEMPFMANEGMAMGWFGDYSEYKNVVIAVNSPRMLRELRLFLGIKNRWKTSQAEKKVILLPNYYPQRYEAPKPIDRGIDELHIGCFGAIRPLKNHLLQLMTSIEFGERKRKRIFFHVNAGRIEMKGEPCLHNMRGVFEHMHHRGHKLVTHEWSTREDFLEICKSVDIGMQVSLSETFNIVAADFVSQGVPVVTSDEIPWSFSYFNADPVDSIDMLNCLRKTYDHPYLNVKVNQFKLTKYTNNTKRVWKKYFNEANNQ